MKPESRLEIMTRHLAEAEAAVARQKQLIKELEEGNHPTQGSHILLGLLEEAAKKARDTLATLQNRIERS